MSNSDALKELIDEIRDLTALLRSKLDNLQLTGDQVRVVQGLSDIDESLGLVEAGEFRTGNGITPGEGFTGIRIGFPSFTYDGEEWHLVGINNDALQAGLRATDGKFLAGGGNVILDSAGITTGSDPTSPSTTSLKVFAASTTYNGESIGAGDILIGDNSANQPNIFWDDSEGELLFRLGTTSTSKASASEGFGGVGARAERLTTQTISHDTNTYISFTSEAYDDAGFFSPTDDKVTIPTGMDGYYVLGAAGIWNASGSGGRRIMWFEKNGGSTDVLQQDTRKEAGGIPATNILVTEAYLEAGDVIRVVVYQDSGGNENVGVGASNNRLNFWIRRQR